MEFNIKIPDNLNELTLKQYQIWVNVAKDQDLDNYFIRQKAISIFTGIKLGHVAQMRKHDVDDISNHIYNLLNSKPVHHVRFKIKSQEFGMIPDFDQMTLGEYVDLEENFKDWGTFHKAMAVLYRPVTTSIKERYEIEEYKGVEHLQDLMEFIPLGVAFGAQVFFWTLLNDLVSCTQSCIVEEAIQTLLTSEDSLLKNGGGTRHSTDWLKEILEDLKR